MLQISDHISIPLSEIEIHVLDSIRAQGAGGQNVNKVSTAVHLRFDINASSLPDFIKERLLKLTRGCERSSHHGGRRCRYQGAAAPNPGEKQGRCTDPASGNLLVRAAIPAGPLPKKNNGRDSTRKCFPHQKNANPPAPPEMPGKNVYSAKSTGVKSKP